MPNKIYHAPETPIAFQESGGDVVLTFKNLGFGAGRVSARVDRGAGSMPGLYRWRAVVQWEDNPVAGEAARFHLITSDGTLADGVAGTADAAITAGQLTNTDLIGLVLAQAAAGSVNNVASGTFEILDRYFSIAVWNASAAKNFKNADNVSKIILTPVPPEIQ